MYETIEAIYEDGKITAVSDELTVKKAKVFLTIIEEMDQNEPRGVPLENLIQYKGIFKKFPAGLDYQKELRDEW